MATNSIIEQLKDESTEFKMVELMKEILAANNQEAKQALLTKLEGIGKEPTASCKIHREIEKFEFKEPTRTLDEWLAKVRKIEDYPVQPVHYKVENWVPYANTNENSYIRNEEHQARLYRLEFTSEQGAGREHEDKIRDAEEQGRVEAYKWNIKAKKEKPVWVVLKRTALGDTKVEDTCLRFAKRPSRNDDGTLDWFKSIKALAATGQELGYTQKHYKATLDRWVSFFFTKFEITYRENGSS